jgi:hypothetical protein
LFALKKREEVTTKSYIYLAARFWSNCVATQLVQMLRHPLLLQNFIVAFTFTKVGVFEARNSSLSEIVLDAVDSFSAMMGYHQGYGFFKPIGLEDLEVVHCNELGTLPCHASHGP